MNTLSTIHLLRHVRYIQFGAIYPLMLSIAFGGFAVAQTTNTALPSPVQELMQRYKLPAQSLAIAVQEVDAAQPAIAWNTRQAMNPASVMKLVTTYSALEKLGPAYTWNTRLYFAGEGSRDPQLNNGVWDGSLILRGTGDPTLTLERFWLLLRQARQRGVKEIRGDLFLDRRLFDIPPHDAGAFDGEPFKPQNVGPDALLLNFKSVLLRFVTDPRNRTVQVVSDPQIYPQVDLKITDGPCGDFRNNLRFDWPANQFPRVSGTYPLSCGEQAWYRAVPDANLYAGLLFRQLWSELGGQWSGKVRIYNGETVGKLLAQADSPALAEVIRDINKRSNNVMARNLFLTLGADTNDGGSNGGAGTTLEKAQSAVRGILQLRGLDFPELVLDNGSGLSRQERISAANLVRLLQGAWRSPVMPEFISSLSVVAQDGTTRKRLLNSSLAGSAHLKTGSLNDVRALAGYVLAASSKRYVLVCLLNDPKAEQIGPQIQDSLLQWAYSNL